MHTGNLQSSALWQSACLAFALSFLSGPVFAQDDTPTSPKVSVAAAYMQDVKSHIVFIGRGEAVDKVDIVARVDGFLEELAVTDGAEVSSGDVLFKIERDSYNAIVSSKTADRDRAHANLSLARIELDRKKTLFSRDAAPESELDIALANEKVAEADLLSAQASITQADLNLSYTEISAPFTGRVGRINYSIGEFVGPNSGPLVTIVREAPIYVTFSISEKQYINILDRMNVAGTNTSAAEGNIQVFIELQNGEMLGETGEVVFIDNRIDPSTGTIALRAKFENKDRLIVDGGFVSVQIQSTTPEAKLLVPLASVQRDQKGSFVLVVNQQQIVEQRYVTTGDQVESSVVIEDGLQEGEAVIVEGLQRVRPGVPVDSVLAAKPEE
ncbi:MAG: efflux RND transporter periplasmic adaptor subunit [Paracoccaceae bacterium]